MVKKIISGGQTGADQAALDVAIKFSSKPVTVKIRAGFSSSKNLIDIIDNML